MLCTTVEGKLVHTVFAYTLPVMYTTAHGCCTHLRICSG